MQPGYGASTNPSIFLRLNAADANPREIAWEEFTARYVPIISGFAHRLGAKPQDSQDVVQDVLLGFFLKSPSFVYDPSKGRFRRYLKVCTYHALQKRMGKEVNLLGKPLGEIDPESVAIDEVWNDVWEQQLVTRAVEETRKEIGHTKTFRAFEKYFLLDEPAETVAENLQLHIKSVYRAKEQVTQLIKTRVGAMRDED